ncbi:MAG: hypothetical protein ACOYLK_03700 [Sphingomonas sp.]
MTRAVNLSKLAFMKICIPAVAFVLLAACNTPPPQNNLEAVAANDMTLDDVTEVQDDSASAPVTAAESQDQDNNAAQGAR